MPNQPLPVARFGEGVGESILVVGFVPWKNSGQVGLGVWFLAHPPLKPKAIVRGWGGIRARSTESGLISQGGDVVLEE